MTARDIFLETCRFGKPAGMFRWEVCGAWASTMERWRGEGMPADASFHDYFGMDFHVGFLNFQGETGIVTGFTGSPYVPPFPSEVIAEDDTTITTRDGDGIIKRNLKLRADTSMPQFLEFPVRTRADWERVRDAHLQLQPERRFPADWFPLEDRFRDRDCPLGMSICGAFGHPRNLFGDDRLLVMYYDDPGLIHEIQEQWVWLYRQIIDEVAAHLQLDYFLFWEDMAFKTAPLISPALFREFMLPYYMQIVSHLRSKGVDLVFVDSDGNFEVLIPLFLEAGINGFFPFERAADMDPVRLRRQYGHAFCMFGGIDKREVAKGRDAIIAHVDSFVPDLLDDGGYIPMLDHTAPPDIPLDSIRFMIERVRYWSEKVNGR